MDTESVIILGAGGGTRELLSLVRHARLMPGCKMNWQVLGILDDDEGLTGSEIGGSAVIGTLADAHKYAQARFISGIANSRTPSIRIEIAKRMNLPAGRWATFIHPQAVVLDSAEVGPGAIIYPGANISSNALIGDQTVAMYGAVVHHDSVVGNGCCICAGVVVAGYSRIGHGCYLGIGATVRNNISIGDGAVIGMGAAVVRDVEPGQIVCGVPAKPLQCKKG